MPIKCINYSKQVSKYAVNQGWLPGARYTNLRDIKEFDEIGLIDIDWKNYDFKAHLEAVKLVKPLLTVARDIEDITELDDIIEQAQLLNKYAKYVIVVPKDIKMIGHIDELIPKQFILGYSVPTRYGGTKIPITEFKNRPVHLLGGRPNVQLKLAKQLDVFSMDCNSFTIDAAFGKYFDGKTFKKHPFGGYDNCICETISNINNSWNYYITEV
jgi:hypothetical protein